MTIEHGKEIPLSTGQYSDRYSALVQVSLSINACLDLPQILEEVVSYVKALTDSDDASILLWDAKSGTFQTGASSDMGQTVSRRVRSKGGASYWIVAHKQPLVVPDVRQDPFGANPMLLETGMHSYAGVPITYEGGVLGVLYALSHQPRRYTPLDLEIMHQLASMAAIAIRNAQLVRSLNEMIEFRKTMAAVMVHDLRNPLSLAKGYVELLSDRQFSLPDEYWEYLDGVQTALGRMEHLIESLLRYQEISDLEEISFQPCNLNSIAEAVAAEFDALARQKNHQLILATTMPPLSVDGDPVLLHEAVGNLVLNAIKYTPSGGYIIIQTARDGDWATISVRDSGPGIAAEDQNRLFQPFTRLKAARKQRGSGLGLSLVKTIVEHHGGFVRLDSEIGHGSVFSIYLPYNAPQ